MRLTILRWLARCDVRSETDVCANDKDPAVKLKLGDNYASVANHWKFYDGETNNRSSKSYL